jgi:peptidoglycan/LPS O-acetylase OafA/YrhL
VNAEPIIARAARTNGMASIKTIGASGVSHPVRLAYIDTWRLLAVVLVISGHLTWNPQLNMLLKDVSLAFLTYYAKVGVFIFFFISGFVVSKTCLEELQERDSFSIKGFYIRRAFRIIPPLLFYLVSCAILSGFGLIPFSFENFIGGSTYLCNIRFVECGYATHTWSLAFEEQFYLCFPLLFSFFVAKRGPGAPIAIALAIASIPFFFGLPWIGQNGFHRHPCSILCRVLGGQKYGAPGTPGESAVYPRSANCIDIDCVLPDSRLR